AFSVGEEELSGIDTGPLVGHMAAWNYFMSEETPENEAFINAWHKFIGSTDRVTNDPMEAHYICFNMWVKPVEAAGTTDTDKVNDAMVGNTVPNPSGEVDNKLPSRQKTKPELIVDIQDAGHCLTASRTDVLM